MTQCWEFAQRFVELIACFFAKNERMSDSQKKAEFKKTHKKTLRNVQKIRFYSKIFKRMAGFL